MDSEPRARTSAWAKGSSSAKVDQKENPGAGRRPGLLYPGRKPLSSTSVNVTASFKPRFKKRLTLVKAAPAAAGSVVRHPNPFSAGNIYYDDKWVHKQETGFSKWLNFILTPDEDETDRHAKVDVAKLWKACSSSAHVPKAPSKEVMSLRVYSIRRELNRLRRDACRLWQSPAISQVMARVEREIENGGLKMRADKDLNKDVGMKKEFLQLILSFHPLWLKIGLETVYGEVLPYHGTDVIALSRYVLTRMLVSPSIQREYAHPSVSHLYKAGYDQAAKQFTLKKFLQLVFFLDNAKSLKIIRHDPCLFCKDSPIKQTRDILIAFSRNYLSGEGDITKHLSYLGYTVTRKQTPLEEYDYAVANLAVDLRDGVRLCRVVELLTAEDLSAQLRYPAVSLLQKIHNVDVSLKALKRSAVGLPSDITAKNIVEGHLEKTLALMWHIIFRFQLENLLSVNQLTKEINFLKKTLQYRVQINDQKALKGSAFVMSEDTNEAEQLIGGDGKDNSWTDTEKIKLLLQWARLVCAHHGLEVKNLSVSFSDGRAFCYILHHYFPEFLTEMNIKTETTTNYAGPNQGTNESSNDSFGSTFIVAKGNLQNCMDQHICNERANFQLFIEKCKDLGGIPILIDLKHMSNTIPDQKVTATFLAGLATRLLDLSVEITAARTIQLFWRRHIAKKHAMELKVKTRAAMVIQRWLRRHWQIKHRILYNRAALSIQIAYKKYRLRKCLRNAINERIQGRLFRSSSIKLQTWWRGYLARKKLSELKARVHAERVHAAIIVQCCMRQYFAKQKLKQLLEKRQQFEQEHAIKLQSWYRMVACRRQFIKQRNAAIIIQKHFRGFQLRQTIKIENVAAVTIQRWLREHWQRRILQNQAASLIQKAYKRYCMGRSLTKTINDRILRKLVVTSSIKLQTWWRCYLARKQLSELKARALAERIQAAITVQCCVRQYFARQKLKLLQEQRHNLKQEKATKIQSWYRMVNCRSMFTAQKNAAIIVQKHFRGFQLRQAIQIKAGAAVTIQRWLRKNWQRRILQNQAASSIQKAYKKYLLRKLLTNVINERIQRKLLVSSSIKLQSWWRGYLARKELSKLKAKAHAKRAHAAIIVQCCVRQYFSRQKLRLLQEERQHFEQEHAIKLQSWYRMLICRRQFLQQMNAAIIIQKHFRGFQLRNAIKIKTAAAMKIQRWLRNNWQRRILQNKAASIIQGAYRRYCMRTSLANTINDRIERKLVVLSSIKLQTWWRGHLARKELSKLKARAHAERIHAAIIVQCCVRQYFARKKLKLLQEERYHIEQENATKIQSLYRMAVCRRWFIAQRNAAIIIQKHFRGFQSRQAVKMKISAALTIQRWLREHWRQRVLKNQAASLIQQAYKKYSMRKSLTDVVNERIQEKILVSSSVKLQTWWRGYLARKQLSEMKARAHAERIQAAVIVQCCVRQYFARQKLKLLQEQRHHFEQENAIRLQSWYRMTACRRLFIEQRNAAICIQKHFRGFHLRQAMKIETEAAAIIQRWMRKNWERRLLENQAASIIQKAFQRYCSRKSLTSCINERIQRKLLVSSSIKLQSWWRGYLAKKELSELKARALAQRVHAAIIIQCCVRQYFSRQKLRLLQEERQHFEQEHAIKLQSWYRMLICRRLLTAQKKAAVIIQKHVRGFQLRQSLNIKIKAAVIIQRWLRKQRQRRILHDQAACLIQRAYKRYRMRESLTKTISNRIQGKVLVSSSIKLQAWWRGHLARKELIGLKARAHMERTHAVIRVQSCVRRYLARQKLKHLQDEKNLVEKERMAISVAESTLKLQSWYRMTACRRWFLAQRSAAIIIQKHFRGFKLRQAINAAHQISSQEEPVIVYDLVVTEEFGKKIEEVRHRALQAQMNAVEENKLGNRAALALEVLYNKKDIAHVIKVLRDLDVSTRFSSACCDQLCMDGSRCVLILSDILNRCNRSIPHMEVVSSILDILINLAKYEPAREIICENSNELLPTLIELMKIFRDKSSEIFAKGCSILWTLAHNGVVLKFLQRQYITRQIREMYVVLQKRNEKTVAERRRSRAINYGIKKQSSRPVKSKLHKLSLDAAWNIRADHVRFHADPFVAIATVWKDFRLDKCSASS